MCTCASAFFRLSVLKSNETRNSSAFRSGLNTYVKSQTGKLGEIRRFHRYVSNISITCLNNAVWERDFINDGLHI